MSIKLSSIPFNISVFGSLLLCLLLSLLMTQAAFADFPSPKEQKEISKVQSIQKTTSLDVALKNAIDSSLLPFSGSVLLRQNGEDLLQMSKGRGINQRTSFIIASLSKQITATLVLQAVDAGSLDLDNTLNSYLFDSPYAQSKADAQLSTDEGETDFDAKFEIATITEKQVQQSANPSTEKRDPIGTSSNDTSTLDTSEGSQTDNVSRSSIIYGIDTAAQNKNMFNPKRYDEQITLHHLLSHTSGVAKLGRANHFEPGSQFQYSNLGYSLLAEVLESVNQQTFAQQITNFAMDNGIGGLYAELGSIDNIRQRAPSLAIGLNEAGNTLSPSNIENTAELLPAGGLIATARAFTNFQQKLHSGQLMSPQSYNLMTSTHSDIKFLWPNMSYGYGLRINREDDITEYSHTGYLAGYMSMSLHYPEFNVDLVMLENISLNLNDLDRVFELHNKVRAIIRQSLIDTKSLEDGNP